MNTEQRELKKLAKALYQRDHVAQAEVVRDLTLIKEAAGPSMSDLVQRFERAIAAGKARFDEWRSHRWPRPVGPAAPAMHKVYEQEDVKTWARISKLLRRHYRSYMTQGLDPDKGWDSQTDAQKLESIQKALSGLSGIREGKHSTRTSYNYTYYVNRKRPSGLFGLGSEMYKEKKTGKGKVINLSDEVTARMASWKKSAPVLWHFVGNAGDAWRSAHRAAELYYTNKIQADKEKAVTDAETKTKDEASAKRKANRDKMLRTQRPGGTTDGRPNLMWRPEDPPKYSGRGRRKKIIKNVAWYNHYAYKTAGDETTPFGIMRSYLVIKDNDHWESLGKKLPHLDSGLWTRVQTSWKKASQRYDLTKYASGEDPFKPSGGKDGGDDSAGPDFGDGSANTGGGGGGGSRKKMKELSKGVIHNSTTGNEFRQWVVNNENEKVKAIAGSADLDPTGSWYNKHIRDAWSAVKALGFDYRSGGKTVGPESAAQANIQADNDTLKAYLLYKKPLKHRDHMLSGVNPEGNQEPSKHGGPFPSYQTKTLLGLNPKQRDKKVDQFMRSSTATGPLLRAYKADVAGSSALQLEMESLAFERAEAAKEAEKAKAEKAKREKEAVKSNDYYIIPPTGEESLVKDSDNNFKVGTIFVSKQNGDTYYVGQAQGRPKQLFSLQLRSMGRGGVTGTNVLSEEELTKLEKVIPDSHWEVWDEFFSDREQYIESLTESQSGWNPAYWFRESRKTEKGHYDKARGNLRKLYDSTRPSSSSLAANMETGQGQPGPSGSAHADRPEPRLY